MTAPLINVIFIGIISALALETVWYWHSKTRGSWKDWPAGRSLMYLLLIIGFGFGYGIVNQFLGQYAARPFVGFSLYLAFAAALVIIRLTIRKELLLGKKQLVATVPTTTGPMNIMLATTNEETMTEPIIDIPGPDHRAEPTGAAAPNKAFWRTALQVGPVAALSLLGVLPPLLQDILDNFGRQLPPEIYPVLVSVTGGVTLTAAIAAKIMANKPVIDWFKKYAPFFAPQKSS